MSGARRLDGPDEAVHARARVVVRKYSAVLPMALVEFCSATGRIGREQHVFRSVESFVAGSIELAAKSARLIVVQPRPLILKVPDQLELEAWIRDREFDDALASLFDRVLEVWVISRPFNVEYTPKFIDLALLGNGSSAGGDSQCDKGPGYGPSLGSLDSKIDSGHIAY